MLDLWPLHPRCLLVSLGVIRDFPNLTGFCEFPIHLVLTGKEKIDLPGNSTIVPAPGQKVTFTNNLTGATVSYVITGATHNQTLTSGNVVSTVTGRNVVLNDETSKKQGIFLLVGTFSFELTSTGAEVSLLAVSGKSQTSVLS